MKKTPALTKPAPTKPAPTKKDALAALLKHVRANLAEVTHAQKVIHDGATHEESKPENDKDTRALEATYLARGLAERVDDLKAAVVKLSNTNAIRLGDDEPITTPALVTLEAEDGSTLIYLLAPVAGGTKLDFSGHQLTVVTPSAPLGMALLGKAIDDDVLVKTPKRTREMVVIAFE